MARIRVLDAQTANQIAAGEVVERPASVVKELVENALDAGGRRILVELDDGGRERVMVQDDGMGMSPEDALLSLERHATSKLVQIEELQRLSTLGFRGEALPSIAAVARVEILSREPAEVAGTRIVIQGGELVRQEPVGCPAGTRVTVRDLFFNTPARRKHLKGVATEFSRAMEIIYDLALAHPDVAFRALHNGSECLNTSGNGRLLDVLLALYGRSYAEGLLPVAGSEGELTLQGYVGRPSLARANRSHQHFLVNGRPVRSGHLREAFEKAYETLLPLHRHPVGVLHLTVPADDVDVNVHPAKLEVRFVTPEPLQGLVRRTVAGKLGARPLIEEVQERRPAPESPGPGWAPVSQPDAPDAASQLAATAEAARGKPTPAPEGYVASRQPSFLEPGPNPSQRSRAWPPQEKGSNPETPPWTLLDPLGQIQNTYIVAEGADGLYVVDQHAAHERLFYEEFLARQATPTPQRQPLSVPLPLEVTPQERLFWENNQALLAEFGFEVEAFGPKSLLIREVPMGFAQEGHRAMLLDLIDQLMDETRGPGRPTLTEERARLTLASCKAAVKANQRLSRAEMLELFRRLGEARAPYTCPHGRPTVFKVTVTELARRFKRT